MLTHLAELATMQIAPTEALPPLLLYLLPSTHSAFGRAGGQTP
jgi:hypothetical protein